jgi:hypothetical protein
MTTFKNEKHTIIFNSCLENKIMKEAFLKHLEKEYNTAPFLFILEEMEFQKIIENDEIKNSFVNIYEVYCKKDSKYELNLSSENKKLLQKEFESIQNQTDFIKTKKLVKRISVFVKQELILDSVQIFLTNSSQGL